MACSLPHTDSEVEALVQRLINEDKGRQDVLLNLAFQFEDSCAVRDDLRKAYEKCNDIPQESRALICTLLKESSEKRITSCIFLCCSSSQADCPFTNKELHQLRMDEEALRETSEEEAMNKKVQEEKIRQEQAENDAFFLEFGSEIAVVFVVVVGCYLASVPHEEDHQYIIVILGLIVPLIIVAIGVEVFWKK
ncbi:hypothetical protein Tco_1386167 [Tanacetum coccineum]